MKIEYSFNYWLGLDYSTGEDVAPEDHGLFLAMLKDRYRELLKRNSLMAFQLSDAIEKEKQLAEEIGNLRKLNQELTEENMLLSTPENCETCNYHAENGCTCDKNCSDNDMWEIRK